MKKYDTIFLDRDGTLNPDPGYINALDQFAFYDFTLQALKNLSEDGNRFCIVTNQSGIGRGKIKIDHLSEIHNYILNQFYENGIELLGIYYCPDHPDQATQFRKPGTKMFNQASEDHQIDLQRSIMIGDALSDLEAGVNLTMDTMLVLTGRGKDTQQNLGPISPTYIVQDLMDGANKLIGIR
jgi:D,D-heptose 1,7-bisphosphate phosphatase